MNYFQSIRAGFDDRSIRRGMIVAEGNYVAYQTWIEEQVRSRVSSRSGCAPITEAFSDD